MDREANSGSDDDAFDEDSVASSDLDDDEEKFNRDLRKVRNNDAGVTILFGRGDYNIFQNMTNEGWEDLGGDISNNTHLEWLQFNEGALDDLTLISLFRRLDKSDSIVNLDFSNNEFSAAGLRSLEPFVQNSTNLRGLDVSYTHIQTEGFNILWQALRHSPIKSLFCTHCGIASMEITNVPNNNLQLLDISNNNLQSVGFNRLLRSLRDSSIEDLSCRDCRINSIEVVTDSFPKNLQRLDLGSNRISSNGCRGLADVLQEGNTILGILILRNNLIDDECVAVLVDALKTNTTLKWLNLEFNSGISRNGRIQMLKLLNDVSSIKATLRSNHTLKTIRLGALSNNSRFSTDIATKDMIQNPFSAGREKVIQTQLHSRRRAELVEIQGVESKSVYGEINPLHLPEVLSLVGCRHGQEELYLALKVSIAELISTINREICLQQRKALLVAELIEIDSELAEIAAGKGGFVDENDPRENKRRRV